MKQSTHPHRIWMIGSCLSLAILLAAPTLSESWRTINNETIVKLDARIASAQEQIYQWEEDARTAKELNSAMHGEDIATYLTPISRAELSARLEPLAATAHLSHMAYTLGPEQPWQKSGASPNIKGLIQSELTIEAEAPMDHDILRFIKSLSSLPGRMELHNLSIKRLDIHQTKELGLRNLQFKATLIWVANGGKP